MSTARAKGTAAMVASLCIDLVRDDPALIERLRASAREREAPFNPDDITAMALDLCNAGILMQGREAMDGGSRVELQIPVFEGSSVASSANALAVGSFTTEFVHTSEDRLAQFRAWMKAEHGDAFEDTDITRERIERSDRMLTIMAHAAGHVADMTDDDQEESPDGSHARFDAGPPDDGIRHV